MCFTMKIIPRMDMDPILFPKNISEGIVLSKNFTFPDPNNKNHPFVSFKEVVFGCGLKNIGFKFGRPMDDNNEMTIVFVTFNTS